MNLETKLPVRSLWIVKTGCVCAILSFNISTGFSQNWTEESEFAGIERDDAVGFSVGNTGFVGTGRDAGFQYTSDFYKFENDSWSQIPSILGDARQYCSSFSFSNQGCIVNGVNASDQVLNELQCFDPELNEWSYHSTFPGLPRLQSASFSIGEKGYCGSGRNDTLVFSDWYVYDPVRDTWNGISDFPDERYESVTFVINGIAYVGLGANLDGDFFNTFYRYSPLESSWFRIAEFPGLARTYSQGFNQDGKGFVCGGMDENGNILNECWEYDPSIDEWSQVDDFPKKMRGMSHFKLSGCNYFVTGLDESFNRIKSTYSSCTDEEIGDGFLIYPNPSIGKIAIVVESEFEETNLQIFNVLGKLVYQSSITFSYTLLDLSDFDVGVYILYFRNDKREIIKKLVLN
ncbi:N-acetylneuraminate epimerase [Parvicella tangerina]|uniref:N-acetylneuraminate epimerase n=2 Tax=Parvicella tangerina TaxID=2829795 RepID=A0A916JLP2_9FLAO|nr:N-acetylneuraminate epimerase [Parvicella tangerina]